MTTVAPYGSWESPITPAMVTEAGIGLSEVTSDGADIYWLESRPFEAGRSVIVRRNATGAIEDVAPEGFDARTRVHEYGGGAYAVHDRVVVSSRFEDQRVYRLDGGEPQPITPEPAKAAADRFADYAFHGAHIICVRERHLPDGSVANELVMFPVDGSAPPRIIEDGHDFYSSPRVSPDGRQLAWLSWDHPNMPWDGTELWLAGLTDDGVLVDGEKVAGGSEESIFQPEWSPDGTLHFVSDRTGWWNIYRAGATGDGEALLPMDAEFGAPQWQFGYRRHGFLDDGTIVAIFEREGIFRLGIIEGGDLQTLPTERDVISGTLAVTADRVWTVAAGAVLPAAVVAVDTGTGQEDVIRSSQNIALDIAYVSTPVTISFPTTGRAVAHAFYYPPVNRDFTAGKSELPPLVVWSHGGPTAATSRGFRLGLQFWTSRGFAVVDVNYRGSVGYGRSYRNALRGEWGVIDTDDCIAAARYLADRGLADPDRMAIRGASAGGYTTLCALTFHDEFATGASYFGVGDLEALARETHKFESRYLDSMVGPYPEAGELYRARSPIHFTERLSSPMLILQGLDDEVVLPSQAEQMVEALEAQGIPYAYVAFAGEGHGFRRAGNIQQAIESELSFYGWVFGFVPAGDITPVEIHGA